MSEAEGTSNAVVLGASMAGLAATQVLAGRFEQVTVVDRDALTTGAELRRGVPQARHAHALLAAGKESLAELWPGIVDELVDAGAMTINASTNAIWYQAGARRVRYRSQVEALSMSRPLLEGVVRRRVVGQPGVRLLDQTSVLGLDFTPDGDRITGVRIEREGEQSSLRADLVVDATGRSAPARRWLEEAGYPAPPTSHINVDIAYATRVVSRLPGDLGGADFLIALAEPPVSRYVVVLPLEGDRWIVTMSGAHGDRPLTTPEGLADFAGSFDIPELVGLVDPSRAASPVMTYRFPSSQRRHVEKLRSMPAGYVMIGDAICSFNPVYGQGMTSAVLQARALGHALDRHRPTSRMLPRHFYRSAARVVANPWRIAAGADFNYPQTTGAKPPGTDLVNRYIAHVMRACHTSPRIAEQMVEVQNLLAPATSLMRPDRVVRVLLAARRSPVRSKDAEPTDMGHLTDGGPGDPVRAHIGG